MSVLPSLHGPGELLKFVLGTYHQPREVDRIFLFIDLKSSTTIAEALGNLAYSCFIRDFFFDLTDALLLTRAEVYQYVGDEVVLTWPLAAGLCEGRCVQCFYQLRRTVAARGAYYLAEYGYQPQFKGGLHGGAVVVTWVGEVKREIVYHGDVLNTAARMQSLCNELRQELIISDSLLAQLGTLPGVLATPLARVQLRGRQHETELYGLQLQPLSTAA